MIRVGDLQECVSCRAEFEVSTANQRYCTVECAPWYKIPVAERIPQAECEGCGKPFVQRTKNHRFCSKSCREYYVRDGIQEHIAGINGIVRGNRGAVSELIAAADLLNNGFEIFRALSQHCSCDLIAMKDNVMHRIEVRTGTVYKGSGKLNFPYNSRRDEGRFDVLAVVVDSGRITYMSPNRAILDAVTLQEVD